MPVPQGQENIKSGYKNTYSPIASQAKEYTDAAKYDGGKSLLTAVADGASLSINESFEKLGMNKLAMEWERHQKQGLDQQMVTVKEAEEKWGLTLDEPIPLHEALFLDEINQDSVKLFENVLHDLSFREGPVNFLGSLAGVLGVAAMLPSNWIGLGVYKHAKNLPRYMKLLTLAQKSKNLRRATDLPKKQKLLAAQQALKIAAAKPVPVLESAAVVGAENVMYAHLKESEGVKTDKALAFGIGAGAGLFLSTIGRALTTSVDKLPKIPRSTPAKVVPAEAAGPANKAVPENKPITEVAPEERALVPEDRDSPFGLREQDNFDATEEIPEDILEGMRQDFAIGRDPELAAKTVERIKLARQELTTTEKLKEPKKPIQIAGVKDPQNPKDAHEAAFVKRVNEQVEAWRKKQKQMEDELAAEQSPAAVFEGGPKRIKEPKIVKPKEEFTAQQKLVEENIHLDDKAPVDDFGPVVAASVDDEVAVAKLRTVAEQTGRQEELVARLEELPGTAKRNEPQLVEDIESGSLSTKVPGHILWGNQLFGKEWEHMLLNAMTAMRKLGIYANVNDLYPQFMHPKAFQGWVENQARYLKRTKGVYTNKQLMNKVLAKRPEQIEYYLEKYGRSMKDAGVNPQKEGAQAKPTEVKSKTSVDGAVVQEQNLPKVDKKGPTPIPEQPKIKVGESKEVEVPVKEPVLSPKERYFDQAARINAILDADVSVEKLDPNYKNLGLVVEDNYRTGHAMLFKDTRGVWTISIDRDLKLNKTPADGIVKEYKTFKGALRSFNKLTEKKIKLDESDLILSTKPVKQAAPTPKAKPEAKPEAKPARDISAAIDKGFTAIGTDKVRLKKGVKSENEWRYDVGEGYTRRSRGQSTSYSGGGGKHGSIASFKYKTWKTHKGAAKHFKEDTGVDLPTIEELDNAIAQRAEKRVEELLAQGRAEAAKTKKVTMVDKDAVRPTVDNNTNAKLALEERYPDIKFQPSKSAVAQAAGPDGAPAPTVGKDDIFNLSFKPKRAEGVEAAPGTVAEVRLEKVVPEVGPDGKPVKKLDVAGLDKKKEYQVIVARNEADIAGRVEPYDDEPVGYKTLRGALNRFKKEVGDQAKVPELDEIKMGPERGAASVQRTAAEVVKALKQLKDCNNGKSLQSGVSEGNPAAAGAVGRGTPGVD